MYPLDYDKILLIVDFQQTFVTTNQKYFTLIIRWAFVFFCCSFIKLTWIIHETYIALGGKTLKYSNDSPDS